MAEFDDSRDAAQQKAFDAILRHALAVERNNNGLVADMGAVVDDAGKRLATDLGERLDNLTDGELAALSRYRAGARTDRLPTRVQGVIKLIDSWVESLGTSVMATWQSEAVAFAQSEIDFTNDLMANILVESSVAAVSAESVYKQAMETPALGTFIEDALRDTSSQTRERVYARVREGIAAGQANSEIIRSLRGTPGARYKDGVLQTTRNNLSSIVRTGRNHLASTAQDETYRALGVEEVVFVATIDGRTTFQCSSLDQTTYEIGSSYPKPPLHWNCRSAIAPYFGGNIAGNRPYVKAFKPIRQIRKKDRPDGMVGQVRASTSMSDFLKRKDNAAFAKQYFGNTRYRLFQEGKLSLKQMVRSDGSRYSIEELRRRHREDFKAVFGDAA
ncbi:minor capsid protein [Halomonas elongata]|uniref:minor capsid protein n=1 Tax=Halomonas elongata TaxID=2746 RepID=UPI00255B2D7F|nr:minor capsid protein [Halomonas elongata]MDL4860793.1 minor capsid protein [Halomonas elongata]